MPYSLHDQEMNTIMKLDNLKTIDQMEAFLAGSKAIAFAVATKKGERYQFVEKLLKRFSYQSLKRQDKGAMIRFLIKVTGYSRQQLTRMIQRYVKLGELQCYQRTVNGFERIYTAHDIQLLAGLDQRHDTPNGFMAKKLCERAYHEFKDLDYERLSKISVSHIYNLRRSLGYKKLRCHYEKTKSPKGTHIGERRKPFADGKPGYIRIDTVHQGDLDGRKGVYHINAVDEITQFEIVVTVEKISELYLIPALETLLEAFPFIIINFHSDNGSEYINKMVAKLLNKLRIEMTKSRPRNSNDNALAEGKNAAVVRKTFGYSHIPQWHADKINEFNKSALNPYINYHRPCLYPTTILDSKGKQKKKYYYRDMMTPYEKLKSIPNAEEYLKKNTSFKILDDIATSMTDNQSADYLQQQRKLLFKQIHEDCRDSA
jgi:transposase InsO family protein